MKEFLTDDPWDKALPGSPLASDSPAGPAGETALPEGAEPVREPQETGSDAPMSENVANETNDGQELSPRELERRRRAAERAKEERRKLLQNADARYKKGDFAEAESFYRQAAIYGDEKGEAEEGVWASRTRGYTDYSCLYEEKTAREFSVAGDRARADVLGKFRGEMEEEIAACREEAEPLEAQVEAETATRREAFAANRNYYFVRFCIAFAIFALFAVACGVSGYFILRSKGAAAPILTGVFGLLDFAAFVGLAVYAARLYFAQRYVMRNERHASTDDGARLDLLTTRIRLLTLAIGGAGEYDDVPAEEAEEAYEEAYEESLEADETDGSAD